MMQTCVTAPASRLLLAGLAGLLAACTTAPAPGEPVEPPQEETVADLLRDRVVTVEALTAEDAGIVALARALSGAELVSFGSGLAGTSQGVALKGALTEALLLSGNLGLLILDVPCDGGAALDVFASGAASAKLAAELVREAPIYESQKTATLADILTVLRGWNAVNIDQSVRIAGRHCPVAAEAAPQRLAVFWGLDQPPGDSSEKDLAAAARKPGEPARNHVWLVQTGTAALSDAIPGSGWLDLRALPESPDVAAWRAEWAATEPLLRSEHPSSGDIIFRHGATLPAEPF